MPRTLILNGTEFPAFEWFEAPFPAAGETVLPHYSRNPCLAEGISDLRPGEASFRCDLTIGFDTTLAMKGDGRKFVVISSHAGRHIAKPS
jgi:hypothetical protein